MSISNALPHNELDWTGAETSFPTGIAVMAAADLKVRSRNNDTGVETLLTKDAHYSIAVDPVTRVATVTPIAFPPAPRKIIFDRETPDTSTAQFENLESYDPKIHTELADRAALRDAEIRRKAQTAIDTANAGKRYDLPIFAAQGCASGELLAREEMVTDVSFPAGMAGSRASAGYAPTSSAIFSIKKNGVEFAQIVFGAGETHGAFVASDPVAFVAGDVLSVVAPSPRDATLSDFSATLAGNR